MIMPSANKIAENLRYGSKYVLISDGQIVEVYQRNGQFWLVHSRIDGKAKSRVYKVTLEVLHQTMAKYQMFFKKTFEYKQNSAKYQ